MYEITASLSWGCRLDFQHILVHFGVVQCSGFAERLLGEVFHTGPALGNTELSIS